VFACICRAVTCDQVTAAIDDGAATLKAVAKATRACTSCGTCRERIVNMLTERKPPCAFEAMPAGMSVAEMAPATLMPAGVARPQTPPGEIAAMEAGIGSANTLNAGMLAAQPRSVQSLNARTLSAA
jgi:bacterioferritin-associated ferredoxin